MRWCAAASLLGLLAVSLWTPTARISADGAPEPRVSASRLTNTDEVRKRLGLWPEYANVRGVEAVKVAVLDYGFDGVNGTRSYLPKNAVVVEHYDPEFVRQFNLGDPDFQKEFEPLNRHGRTMAQIVWAVTGSNPNGPQFYLLNANGPTMLRRAVRYAIEQKVDIILFCGSFEGGGNGDGRGPVNRIVTDAIASGIIWVNAAGNFGRHVYNGPVRVERDGHLRFRDGADGTVLRFRNRLDENAVTVTLTWNDYRETEDAGTTKDLDLYVEDWTGKVVGSSEKKQVAGREASNADETLNPRERIVLSDLGASGDFSYRIRIRKKGGNFTAEDRVRVLITATRDTYFTPENDTPAEAVKFIDATGQGEIYPPADHPLVLTVGDSNPDSAIGPTADNRLKPDVIMADSRAFFSDGQVSSGSSSAAAYFAGVVTVLTAAEPKLNARHLFRLAWPGMPRQGTTHISNPSPRPTNPLATSAARLRVTGPRGGTLDLQFGPTSRDSAVGTSTVSRKPNPSTGTSALGALRASRPEVPATLENRVWRTPTRTRLSEIVREGG